ncbi:MAG: L-histidine N(alpha)-methyltransferase [Chloroflexi bacterium]|nr:L-histidine N(alpha)-methyltransferase [Chloroflexota bacterium]
MAAPSWGHLTLIEAGAGTQRTTFAEDVAAGLTATPKSLPCRYFYDEEGSLLFEAICELPEYYVTRAEREILEAHANEIAAQVPSATTLVELGSGSAAKTRLLLDAFFRHRQQQRRQHLCYVPIDISRSMLEESSHALLNDYPALEIRAIAAEYDDGLRFLRAESERPKLILWLGSNVGNLERAEAARFLGRVRATMTPADRLLMGVDLRKSREVLEPAYDDAQGVTARFNLNLLARINRELGGEFDLDAFEHRAHYDEVVGRIEMYLVSTRTQRVRIRDLDLTVSFEPGEPIHTENSYKYSLAEIDALSAAAGLAVEARWLDRGERFAVNLFVPA